MGETSGILNRFRKGDISGVYTRLYRPLLLYASQCLTERFAFLSEDCVQEAIYKAYQRRDNIASESALRNLLYASVHNKAIDVLRKGNSGSRYSASLPLSEEDLVDTIIENETLDRLYTAIRSLPADYKDIFFLLQEGKTLAEIATELGVSESTILRRKGRMIELLREQLADSELLLALLATLTMLPE